MTWPAVSKTSNICKIEHSPASFCIKMSLATPRRAVSVE